MNAIPGSSTPSLPLHLPRVRACGHFSRFLSKPRNTYRGCQSVPSPPRPRFSSPGRMRSSLYRRLSESRRHRLPAAWKPSGFATPFRTLRPANEQAMGDSVPVGGQSNAADHCLSEIDMPGLQRPARYRSPGLTCVCEVTGRREPRWSRRANLRS